MLSVRRLRAADVDAYRQIRLEALEIAPPEAFASTLAREQAFSRQDFIHRLENGCALG